MIDSPYLNALLAIPGLSPLSLEAIFFLLIFRFAPIVVLAPFFGAKTAPMVARVGIALFISIFTLPMAIGSLSTFPTFDNRFLVLALKELLIGSLLGFLALIPFLIAQSSGVLIDFMRGSSMLMAQDPTTQTQASPIGILYNWILIVIYFTLGGPFYFIDAFAASLHLIPLDATFPAHFFSLNLPLWHKVLISLQEIFNLSIQLAAPSILAILMAEVFLGIANRLAPQVQIAFLGMSLKSLFGLTLLWAAWFLILKQTGKISMEWTHELQRLFTL